MTFLVLKRCILELFFFVSVSVVYQYCQVV